MRIITISREFGSGGRELGKCLAGLLGIDYYDREIITAIARQSGLAEDYVERALEAVPREYEDASLAFGAAPIETYFCVSVPAAKSGIAKQRGKKFTLFYNAFRKNALLCEEAERWFGTQNFSQQRHNMGACFGNDTAGFNCDCGNSYFIRCIGGADFETYYGAAEQS